jgi:hypothetical protein
MVKHIFFLGIATVTLTLGISATPAQASNEQRNGEPSKYSIPKHYLEYEKCVRIRESNGRWDAISPSRTYRGAYQISPALARGATWHMHDDIIKYTTASTHQQARHIARLLRSKPINKWPAWAQTSAFIQTLDGHHKETPWSGKKHWKGGRWSC